VIRPPILQAEITRSDQFQRQSQTDGHNWLVHRIGKPDRNKQAAKLNLHNKDDPEQLE
jgi:hypothetical protein